MLIEIFSKLLSESLLSLYPIFVKYIDLPLHLQLWSRFITYAFISAFFIDYSYLYENLFSKSGILLSVVTVSHVYTSYRGFQLLESGVSYTIFYLYPLMILLMAGKNLHPIMILSLLGVYLLASNTKETFDNGSKEKKKVKDSSQTQIANHIIEDKKGWYQYEGIIMIFLAALTEAFIYFIVLNLKTNNNWNHIFISYFLAAILFSGFFIQEIKNISINSVLSISLFGNMIIGLIGYYLRFFAISRLDTTLYAPLSYFGIVMAYFYGIIFNNDILTWQKVFGTGCIVLPNIYLSFYK